jgi:hypothetical protein
MPAAIAPLRSQSSSPPGCDGLFGIDIAFVKEVMDFLAQHLLMEHACRLAMLHAQSIVLIKFLVELLAGSGDLGYLRITLLAR